MMQRSPASCDVDNIQIHAYYQQQYLMPCRENYFIRSVTISFALFVLAGAFFAQTTAIKSGRSSVDRGSLTAKNGFKNEDEIAVKFRNWKADPDARAWLTAMGYKTNDLIDVAASKPHGEKSDVEVRIKTSAGERTEGISIKLVSSPNGFNQIDKRWLSHYVRMWQMPREVEHALSLFVGETPPIRAGRAANRMFLDELDAQARRAVIAFFESRKSDIVSDLFQGDGPHAARWVMVAFKATDNTRWTLRRVDDVVRSYSEGPVMITKGGNLKIGRITMQRKGGDGGRDTAKMLQFKINPMTLFT
jgi:hypothetical protein